VEKGMSSANTLEIRGKRSEINNAIISRKGEGIENILLLAKPSKRILFLILNAFPKLKRISIGKGLARQISKNQLEALGKVGIEVELVSKGRGRKNRFTEEERKSIMMKFRKDKKTIERYGITRRTVYYWMKKQ
jgi:hypothetical protein